MSEKRKVLIVDDEPDALEFVKAVLEPEDLDVITAANGQECLDRARAEKPDLIISDVMMPVLDGFDACAKLKEDEATEDIPVILLTAVGENISSTRYTRRQGLDIQADDYIPKPVDPDALLKAAKSLL